MSVVAIFFGPPDKPPTFFFLSSPDLEIHRNELKDRGYKGWWVDVNGMGHGLRMKVIHSLYMEHYE